MKNIILYYRPLIFLFAFSLLSSCKKPQQNPFAERENKDVLSIIESYYGFTKKKVDGTFLFESNLLNNDPGSKESVLIGGVFYDDFGHAQNGGGPVSIGGHRIGSTGTGTYGFDKIFSRSDVYGKEVTFTLTPPARSSASTRETGSVSVTGTLYSPMDIVITNVPPRKGLVIPSGMPTPVTWNTDPNNPNGVIVIAEYLPTLYAN